MPQTVRRLVHVVCHLAPARGAGMSQVIHVKPQALFVVMHRLARSGRADDCLPGMGRSLLLTAYHPGLRSLRLMPSQVYCSATL